MTLAYLVDSVCPVQNVFLGHVWLSQGCGSPGGFPGFEAALGLPWVFSNAGKTYSFYKQVHPGMSVDDPKRGSAGESMSLQLTWNKWGQEAADKCLASLPTRRTLWSAFNMAPWKTPSGTEHQGPLQFPPSFPPHSRPSLAFSDYLLPPTRIHVFCLRLCCFGGAQSQQWL